jgi:DIS3-like exonuclease 1
MTVADFESLLTERRIFADDKYSTLTKLRINCEDYYQRRNSRKSQSGDSAECITLTDDDIRRGLAQGTFFRGRLEVTKENPAEAYVKIPEKGRYFVRKEHYFRSLHHDSVIIQPLDESQWGRPVGRRRLVYQRSEEDDDDDLTNEYTEIPPVPSAKVVATMIPSRRTYVATMTDQPLADETNVLVVPMDVRIPKIRVNTRSWQNLFQKRLLVQVDDWEDGSNYPKGRVVKVLGPVGDLEVEIASLLHENEVELDPFSPAALACLPAVGANWEIPLEEICHRRDLRENRRIFSVDPPGCQDIDDTMHAEGA